MKFTLETFFIIMLIYGILYVILHAIHEEKARTCQEVWTVPLSAYERRYNHTNYKGATIAGFCRKHGITPETDIRTLNRALKQYGYKPVYFREEPDEPEEAEK